MDTPKIWPVGTLQRSLADAAAAKADGTHVDARDLGAVASTTKAASPDPGLPFLVVTDRLRWCLGWAPTNDEEARIHDALRFERAMADQAAVAAVADADAHALASGPAAVFESERAVRAMNAEAQADFLDQLVQAGHVERTDDGDDADDWDVDDGPANDPEALAAETAAEDAILTRAAAALALGQARWERSHPYPVSNPFTSKRTWFAEFHQALAYASAASAADVLDGDLGVWSASGFEEYRLFKGGRPYREDDDADDQHERELERHGYEQWRAQQTPAHLAAHDARVAKLLA